MSVEYIKETWPGRDVSDDIRKHANLARTFEVRTTDPNDDGTVACGDSSGLPRLGDEHPNYPIAFVVKVSGRQRMEDPTLWDAIIEYDTELRTTAGAGGGSNIGGAGGQGAESTGYDSSGNPTKQTNPQERPENPIDRAGVWTRTSEKQEIPFEIAYAVDGSWNVPVVNSAGLPYDPPLTTRQRIHVWGLNKNADPDNISFDTTLDYLDHVNDGTWMGITAAGTVLLDTFRTQGRYENGYAFLECYLEFHYNPNTWRRYPIDRGFQELIEEFGVSEWVPIRDPKTGIPFTEPQLLDGTGRLLAAGESAVLYPETGYREFPSANFSTLMTLLGM